MIDILVAPTTLLRSAKTLFNLHEQAGYMHHACLPVQTA